MMRRKFKMKTVSFQLSDDLVALLENKASKLHVSKSALLRVILVKYFDEENLENVSL